MHFCANLQKTFFAGFVHFFMVKYFLVLSIAACNAMYIRVQHTYK